MQSLSFARIARFIKRKPHPEDLLLDIAYHPDCFETVSVLLKLYKPFSVCDVGANKGYWTYVLHKLNPRLRHAVLIEPQQKLYNDLVKIPLGNVGKVIYSCGLGEK